MASPRSPRPERRVSEWIELKNNQRDCSVRRSREELQGSDIERQDSKQERSARPRFDAVRRWTWAFMAVVLSFMFRAPVAFAASSGTSRLPNMLGSKQMLVATAFVSTFGVGGMNIIGVRHLAKEILIACVRSTAQLFLLGGFILQRLFGTTKPAIVWTWIVGVGLLAAQQASSRVEYTYTNLRRHLTISVLSSGLGILTLSLAGSAFGELQPWYQPRTLIPVAGMLFGNTLSSVSLGASSLTKGFAQSSSQVELRLSRGACSKEAIRPIIKSSLSSALTPTINSLAATGIVQIPGTMTGMVLSGQTPGQAALYQSMILFLITATACSTVQLVASLVSHELMHWREDRLEISELVPVSKDSGRESFSLNAPLQSIANVTAAWFRPPRAKPSASYVSREVLVPSVVPLDSTSTASTMTSPVLKVNKVLVPRALMEVSFDLFPGVRIGITGSSGMGKTQILKTLVGLEHCRGKMDLDGVDPCTEDKWPEWRRQVCWVSQDRTTLDGTPREFFQEIQSYHTHQRDGNVRDPTDIATEWGLPISSFDRPWSTLSGGEAQRASLAIALSFEPRVLLLDEVTAGLDEDTEQSVERSLAARGIPIVMVTHSRAQLDRFCTHHMDLNGAV